MIVPLVMAGVTIGAKNTHGLEFWASVSMPYSLIAFYRNFMYNFVNDKAKI